MVNETVNNLTQAICNQWTEEGDRTAGPGSGAFALVAFADTQLFYGQENIELLSRRGRAAARRRSERRAAPPCRAGLGMGAKRAGGVVSPPRRSGDSRPIGRAHVELRSARRTRLTRSPRRDFSRIAQMQVDPADDPMVKRTGGQAVAAVGRAGRPSASEWRTSSPSP